MNKKISFSLSNIKLSHIFLFFIVIYFFWGAWYELSIADTIYSVCTMALAAWAVINLVLNSKKSSIANDNTLMYLCVTAWCALMFLAYNFSMRTQTVSFFGISMDSHARIVVYYAILLLPGIILRDTCRIKIGSFFKLLITAILVSSLAFTLYAVAVFPDAVRARATAEYLGYEDILFGLPTYSMVYSMSLFFPWLLMKFKKSKGFDKILYLGLNLCLIALVALSQFATALIAMIIGFVVYCVVLSKNKPFRAILLVAIIIAFLVVGIGTWGELLIDMSQNIEGAWGEKLVEIGEFLKGSEASGDLGTRIEYYSKSFSSFLKSPIVGMLSAGRMPLGGHATLIDMFALVGLFGTIPFVIMIIKTIKKLTRNSVDLTHTASVWGTIASFLVLLVLKNIITAIAILFSFVVLLPILYNSEADNERSKKTIV